jgi:hypothetical protein
MKRARKPGPFRTSDTFSSYHNSRCSDSDGHAFAFVDSMATEKPRDLRRLAAWCEKAAAWLEQEGKR